MPVVGYIFLFNTELSAYFSTTIPNYVEGEGSGIGSYLYKRNLVFLYFGLLAFGLGVGLYTIFVPRQIRSFPSVRNYIITMEEMKTRNLTLGSFENVVGLFSGSLEGEERSRFFSHNSWDFPLDISEEFHRFIEECFLACDHEKDSEDDTERRNQDPRFWTGSGTILTDEIIEVMYSGRRIDELLRASMYKTIIERSKRRFLFGTQSLRAQ